MSEEKEDLKTEDIKQVWNKFKGVWHKVENTINWVMICILIVAVMGNNIALCNQYYQEKLLNNTFLQEVMEYNNEIGELNKYPEYEINYNPVASKPTKDLNIIKLNTSTVGG